MGSLEEGDIAKLPPADNSPSPPPRRPEEKSVDYVFKIVVIGDSAVGKTQILGRFTRDEFTFGSKSTIGVEFQTRTVSINKKLIKAQIWGTAGQERYRAVTSAYYRGAMLVYDITRRQSSDHVARWVNELRAHADNSIVVMLIANKADLNDKRAVPTEDALEFAEEQGLFFSETSAFNGENVESAFLTLLDEIHGVISRKTLSSGRDHDECGRKIGGEVLILKGTKVVVFQEGKEMETVNSGLDLPLLALVEEDLVWPCVLHWVVFLFSSSFDYFLMVFQGISTVYRVFQLGQKKVLTIQFSIADSR